MAGVILLSRSTVMHECFLNNWYGLYSQYFIRQSLWDEWRRVSHCPTNWWAFLLKIGLIIQVVNTNVWCTSHLSRNIMLLWILGERCGVSHIHVATDTKIAADSESTALFSNNWYRPMVTNFFYISHRFRVIRGFLYNGISSLGPPKPWVSFPNLPLFWSPCQRG